MDVIIKEYAKGYIKCVEFNLTLIHSHADALLFRAAADWIDAHPNYFVISVILEDSDNMFMPCTWLKVFFEDKKKEKKVKIEHLSLPILQLEAEVIENGP